MTVQMQNEQFMLQIQQQELQFAQEMALLRQQAHIDLQQQLLLNINPATTAVIPDIVPPIPVYPVHIGTDESQVDEISFLYMLNIERAFYG
eukprot:15337077-Ditylum_brightwellii.AAC.1